MIFGRGGFPSRIMLIGDFPAEGSTDAPFTGGAGMELNKVLAEAGIMKGDCYETLAVKERPPLGIISAWITRKKKDILPTHILLHDRYVTGKIVEARKFLVDEISRVDPNVIVTLGETAFWLLSGRTDVDRWRSSMLEWEGRKLIPTFSPHFILKQWDCRPLVIRDLERVKTGPPRAPTLPALSGASRPPPPLTRCSTA